MSGPAHRLSLAAGVAAAVILVDQVTKTLAEDNLVAGTRGVHVVGPVWLTLTYNSGTAFGIGRGAAPVVETVVVLLVAVLLVVAGRRSAHSASRLEAVALGLLSGGAVSNLADRVFRHHGGAVTDFINALEVGHRELWPVFNVADACIVVGAVLLVLSLASAAKGRPPGRSDPERTGSPAGQGRNEEGRPSGA